MRFESDHFSQTKLYENNGDVLVPVDESGRADRTGATG